MICPDCQGTGGHVYDEDSVPCCRCSGNGSFWRLSDWMMRLSIHKDMLVEDIRFTKIGKWYWKRWGMDRRARRMAREHTAFQLQCLHGRSLERMREWATHIENGMNVQRAYQIEQRLVAEADRACKLRPIGGWSKV